MAAPRSGSRSWPDAAGALSGAQLLVRALERRRVGEIYGFPGPVPELVEMLQASAIDYLPMRQGQAAGFVSEAVARFAHRPAVCYGALEFHLLALVAAVASARLTGAPVLVVVEFPNGSAERIAARVRLFARSLAKHVGVASTAAAIPSLVDHAYATTLHGRPGPVVLLLADTVLAEQVSQAEATQALEHDVLESARQVEDRQVDAVYAALLRSRAPLVVAGDELARQGLDEPFRSFVERFQVPVLTTLHGKGVIPDDHPLCLGTLGPEADDAYDAVVGETDLVLFVGSDVPAVWPGSWLRSASGTRLVVKIGDWTDDLAPPLAPDLEVVTSVGALLQALTARDPGPRPPRLAVEEVRERARARLRRASPETGALCELLDVIGARLHRDDVVVCDAGLHVAIVARHYRARQAGAVLFGVPAGLGYAVPGAIGIKSRSGERCVVALCTDAGLLMTVQELETSVRSFLPVVVVLLPHPFENVPFTNDVLSLVAAFGPSAVRARTLPEFDRAFRTACESPVATVIAAPGAAPPAIVAAPAPGSRT